MTPNKDELLTIDDLPSLPNGMSTVARVAVGAQYTDIRLAHIRDDGLLVDFDDRVFKDSHEVIEVVNGDDSQ